MSHHPPHRVIGISCGDLNGIGMEIILKTFDNPMMLDICTPVIFASPKVVSYHRKALELKELNYQTIASANELIEGKINVFEAWTEGVNLEFGKEDPQVGAMAMKSFEVACDALEAGWIHALVTAPVNKNNVGPKGENFTGHTGYLSKRFKAEAMMILTADDMRVALLTQHVPVSKVSEYVTEERIVSHLTRLKEILMQDFGVRKPRIAVLGLNPHAGDGGVIGEEEKNVITPAIDKAKEAGVLAFGPFPSDGFFGLQSYKRYDAVLAMYHDQGLIPFKFMHFTDGVNYSGGLPVVRTSPDHGTAYDIAGRGLADESSMRNAIYSAIDILEKRAEYKDLNANVLPFSKVVRERG